MFFNELDLLELRLHELSGVVDRFVIIEANVTHSGRPKSLNFEANRHRFAAFSDKIIYHGLISSGTMLSPSEGSWRLENSQRNHIVPVLKGLGGSADDIVIISDADEIPRASIVQKHRAEMGFCRLRMDMYSHYLNLLVAKDCWAAAVILPYEQAVFGGVSATDLRNAQRGTDLHHAGWHFTSMGGAEKVRDKIQSFAHVELNRPEITSVKHIERCLQQNEDFFNRPSQLSLVSVGSSFPSYLIESTDRFRHLIK